jgi:nuclear pore complex protein Nup205
MPQRFNLNLCKLPSLEEKETDNLHVVHYFPTISGYISHFLSAGRRFSDAKTLNDKILGQSEQKPWSLIYVHAAIRAWWLAEYSGWQIENHTAEQATQEEGQWMHNNYDSC